MKTTLFAFVLAAILSGCASRHTAIKPQGVIAPSVMSRGNHIWIKPGTNSTHITIGKVRQW